MTNAELRDAAIASLKRTTISYPTYKQNGNHYLISNIYSKLKGRV